MQPQAAHLLLRGQVGAGVGAGLEAQAVQQVCQVGDIRGRQALVDAAGVDEALAEHLWRACGGVCVWRVGVAHESHVRVGAGRCCCSSGGTATRRRRRQQQQQQGMRAMAVGAPSAVQPSCSQPSQQRSGRSARTVCSRATRALRSTSRPWLSTTTGRRLPGPASSALCCGGAWWAGRQGVGQVWDGGSGRVCTFQQRRLQQRRLEPPSTRTHASAGAPHRRLSPPPSQLTRTSSARRCTSSVRPPADWLSRSALKAQMTAYSSAGRLSALMTCEHRQRRSAAMWAPLQPHRLQLQMRRLEQAHHHTHAAAAAAAPCT